jgi:hypothetical protein
MNVPQPRRRVGRATVLAVIALGAVLGASAAPAQEARGPVRTLEQAFKIGQRNSKAVTDTVSVSVVAPGRVTVEANWAEPDVMLELQVREWNEVVCSRRGSRALFCEAHVQPEVLQRSPNGVTVVSAVLRRVAGGESVSGNLKITYPTPEMTSEQRSFRLPDDDRLQFRVRRTGPVIVDVSWPDGETGEARSSEAERPLRVDLYGPYTQMYGRAWVYREGPSPLRLEHVVTRDDLAQGDVFTVDVSPTVKSGSVPLRGIVRVAYPKPPPR